MLSRKKNHPSGWFGLFVDVARCGFGGHKAGPQ